ncbi:MAG: aminodeoxychorismate/anthranilate synthase component II [Bacteroidetes bacterium]|nr:aminodeoxychorismate/anthranilate synthase component II [Bacteroidota bacterium]
MLRVLLLDNHDSFTYNLVQLLRECDVPNQLDIRHCEENPEEAVGSFDRLIISPGPGLPSESGRLMHWIAHYATKLPVLGVCLGHQALGQFFGAELKQLAHSAHGQRSPVEVEQTDPIFSGLPKVIHCGRYHSWVIANETMPDILRVTATDAEGHIMAFSHRQLPVFGLQFHPESYMTDYGAVILRNFLTANGIHH